MVPDNRRNVMVLGPIEEPQPDRYAPMLSLRLRSLGPRYLVSDFSPGWGELGLQAAVREGIPIIGAAPFPSRVLDEYRKRTRSAYVAAKSVGEFLGNPDIANSYYGWLREYVGSVIVHSPSQGDSAHVARILSELRDLVDVHSI